MLIGYVHCPVDMYRLSRKNLLVVMQIIYLFSDKSWWLPVCHSPTSTQITYIYRSCLEPPCRQDWAMGMRGNFVFWDRLWTLDNPEKHWYQIAFSCRINLIWNTSLYHFKRRILSTQIIFRGNNWYIYIMENMGQNFLNSTIATVVARI